jgi:hypothetical protein
MPPGTRGNATKKKTPAQKTPAQSRSSTPSVPPKIITPRAPKTKWTNEEITFLVDGLQQAVDDGNTAEGGFKENIFNSLRDVFNDPLKKKDRALSSKWTRLKADYKEVKWLREESSGFGWDDEKQIVTADEQVWLDLKEVYISFFFSRRF